MSYKTFSFSYGHFQYCLVLGQEGYEKICKEKDFRPDFDLDDCDAAVVPYVSADNQTTCIVVIPRVNDLKESYIPELLVHESVHVWQFFADKIGEKSPSIEFEAYTIQEIFRNLMGEYKRQESNNQP